MAEPPRHLRLDGEDALVSTAARVLGRAVPEAFAAQLAAAFPRRDGLSWLMARWEPGEDWAPVERWVIWEITPWHALPTADAAYLRMTLEGPNPRDTGHYCGAGRCACALKRNRWTGGRSEAVDYFRQWQVAQEMRTAGTPGFPRVIWIVQGDTGGHPPVMDPISKQLAQAAGLPHEFPSPGDGPYADLDQRVIEGLLHKDRLRDAEGRLRDVSSAELAAEDRDRAQHAADRVLDFILERMSGSVDEAAWLIRKHDSAFIAAPHGTPLEWTDPDTFRQSFRDDCALIAS
ncbi:MAG TPA: hypothetical protein DGD08_08535 [Gemmatimonas aurantiaca]|uniref:Uncharacterized protein n=1 Tax=Gemmatimonas aurantiaca TaxID=173480 RepID=A0A3D4V826_9BACT|nr:hypothetical protein [Gemmatimonas aurantiaca]HCT57245.1 hypothetical protein [Gemmatimonas aurantiaca]